MNKIDAILLSSLFVGIVLFVATMYYEPCALAWASFYVLLLVLWQAIGSHNSQVIKKEKFSG